MNKTILIIVFVGFILLNISAVAGEYWDEREELVAFLSSDRTNFEASNNNMLSSSSSYLLAKNAYENNLSFGMVKLYNHDEHVAYYFCYYITEENHYVFIDPMTDAMYMYNEARHRLSSGIDIPYVKYQYYYPSLRSGGSGVAPNHLA